MFASVAMAFIASVVDSASGAVPGNGSITLFSHSLSTHGALTGAKTTHPYPLKFPVTLTTGHAYTLVTYFEVLTWAEAASPPTFACGSVAVARVGTSAPTMLEWVRVA